MTVVVVGTYATSHRTILAQCVAYAETHHGILILGALGQIAQELTNLHEAVTAIEVVAVDDTERFLDDILTHQHSMVGTPGLLTTLRNGEALGQCVKCLETQLTLHLTLIFGKNLRAELLLKILTNDPYYLAKASLNGIINTIVHNGLTIGAKPVELLQTTITASHTCSQKK